MRLFQSVRRALQAAVATSAIAVGLGFAGCDESKSERSGRYDANASAACFKTHQDFRNLQTTWTVRGPKRYGSGDDSGLLVSLLVQFQGLADLRPVDVFFAETAADAKKLFEQGAPNARALGILDQVLQRRSNVLLQWHGPASQRHISAVIRCLRRSPD